MIKLTAEAKLVGAATSTPLYSPKVARPSPAESHLDLISRLGSLLPFRLPKLIRNCSDVRD